MAGGNTSKAIIWLSDTAIVKKALEGKVLYYVADAVTGEPITGEAVEFFGWRQERLEKEKGIVLKRYYNVLTKKFTRTTDGDGQIILGEGEMPRGYQWLATVATKGGRHAYLGFQSVWYNQRHDQEYKAEKAFAISDRPVYRPGEEVHYKLWMRHAQYDQEDVSQFAGRKVQAPDLRSERGENLRKGLCGRRLWRL